MNLTKYTTNLGTINKTIIEDINILLWYNNDVKVSMSNIDEIIIIIGHNDKQEKTAN